MLAQQIIEEVVARCGKDHQLVIAIEELSELQKELTKEYRGKGNRDNILEELADVIIILKEIIYIEEFTHDEIFIEIQKKLRRTEERLNDGRCESL